MKKILLFSIVALGIMNSNAQQRVHPIDGMPNLSVENTKTLPVIKHATANKKTRGGSRWYSHPDALGIIQSANLRVNYLWADSTMKANFGGTQDNIWLKSISQVLDPKAFVFNDPSLYPGEIEISSKTGNYSVDSVAVVCNYFRSAAKPTIVDTLIVSVSTGNGTGSDLFFWSETQAAVVNNYATDTVFIADAAYNFATNTIAKSTGSIAYTKKILLNAASANDTLSSGWNYFSFPVTGLSSLTPAMLPVMTVTFKSGDTWVPNVDSIGSMFNSFNFASFRQNPPAGFRDYTKRDYNKSSYMRNDTTGWGDLYIPSFYSNSPSYESHWFDWKLSCTSCFPTSVSNVVSNISSTVSPNPASENVTFSLNLKESAKNVTVEISNALGQVVKTSTLGNVNANVETKSVISVRDLSAGMYIYTINADGQKSSNKLMIK